ncbi:MAG: cellobiose phosphorylase [Notoacmeibacter sp.]|nr:cellobiose phosphorylase [Notoacmeibacter sp.]
MNPAGGLSQKDPSAQKMPDGASRTDRSPRPPEALDVLANLDKLPAWLGRVRRYCGDPPPDHEQAADWLLDNDYQVSRAIREVRRDLPPEFYRRLSGVDGEGGTRLPGIFNAAHGILKELPARFRAPAVVDFLRDYQRGSPFTIAELWALPSMLRLAALEILGDGFAALDPELEPPFVPSRFAAERRSQAPTDRIARAITALAAVRSIEWRDVFDAASLVEALLGADPAGVYPLMDFETRDRYRRVVEDLSDRSGASEKTVADTALEFAGGSHAMKRMKHVGYWLIDEGRATLERRLGYRVRLGDGFRRALLRHAGKAYAAAFIMLVSAVLLLPLWKIRAYDAGPFAQLAGLLLFLLPATMLSVALLHWVITRLVEPRLIAMMDFSDAIPADCPTCVVVPVIVTSAEEVAHIAEQLEIRWLSNSDPMLRFVLLSDFGDAPQEHMPGDAAITDRLKAAVRALNDRHGEAGAGLFHLLHRPRRYNPAEGNWLGWERKRGKLEQFNEFVLGGSADAFEIREGDIERLRGTRFVITLDADTALPPGSAARMIGALAHPLNSPVVDQQTRKVVAGYTIVQPRVEVLPFKGSVSLFCRFYAGDTAIDIYSRAVSDVYQDLFAAGIYVGKGIYDVAAFQACLEGRTPENTILSHDLFEGVHGRVALATDIVLYEDFPQTYAEYSWRLHRWIRGDWQLLPWLKRTIPLAGGQRARNSLSIIDRWKIVDNLRRSLLAPALLLFFIGGWMALPGSAWVWTGLAVAAPAAYLLGEAGTLAIRVFRRGYRGDLAFPVGERLGRWFLTIAFLVSDTLISLDAIGRTLWRLAWSRSRLLQWRTAAQAGSLETSADSRINAWRRMWPSTAFATVLALDLAIYGGGSLLPAAPVLALWIIAPEIAVWLGKPRTLRRQILNRDERTFLKAVARRTWLYFEIFAGPDDNWLPPDNFQEAPRREVAHRTSPTNIGLFLTSAQAALDFGFTGAADFAARMRNALDSIDRLESHRGHVLNWYDTRTLEPLEPRYVSTVDSGNLAVCLVSLRQGCRDLAAGPAIAPQTWDGLSCTLDLLFDALDRFPERNSADLNRCKADFLKAIGDAGHPRSDWCGPLREVGRLWLQLEELVREAISKTADIAEDHLVEIHMWNERVHHHIRALSRDFATFLPWLAVAEDAPEAAAAIARELADALAPSIALNALDERKGGIIEILDREFAAGAPGSQVSRWLERMREAVDRGMAAQEVLRKDLLEIAERAEDRAFGMDFAMLYDPEARLFRIGYNVSSGQIDANHYDLLATEARIASYFAIAKRDVPLKHWFALGRPVTRLRNKPSVLSWNGSMFEYLMPAIFLPGRRDTLLGESEAIAVDYQRAYGRQRGVPWGISESAFAATDREGNYQYRAFGAPGLALRRGMTEDLVIAPYASALALCCWPTAAVRNMRELQALGALGTYGFHDAMDFTPERVPEGRDYNLVMNYMAHHHGMTMAAIANALNDDIFARRFLSEKRMQSVNMLLQERVPWGAPVEKGRIEEVRHEAEKEHEVAPLPQWVPSRAAMVPQMQMLGNGRMASWISESGAGYLVRQGISLTRWRPDPTCDAFGYWIYVRDVDSGETWSVGRSPSGVENHDVTVIFNQHMVETFRRDRGIAIRMEAVVAAGDDADIREISVTNESGSERTIDFTSYAEVVLAPPLEDERHPAFSKLFVGSRYLRKQNGLLFTRRPRRPESRPPVLLHRLASDDPAIAVTGYETDRARFLGRLGDRRAPRALDKGLSGTTGWTLDPIMSLQTRIRLDPYETKRFSFVTVAGDSRGEVLEAAERHASGMIERPRHDAARAAAREVARFGIDPPRLPELQVLASLLLAPHPDTREMPGDVVANRTSQPDLWQFGISGDFPILLLQMESDAPSNLLELLIKAQRLWRRGQMRMDLVVLRNEAAGYEAPLRERILSILRESDAYEDLGTSGGIHLLSAASINQDLIRLLCAAAHVVLDDDGPPLATILDRVLEHRAPQPPFAPPEPAKRYPMEPVARPRDLEFDNGIGGFDRADGDYVIYLEAKDTTPSPWCNVLANDGFGTIVSEAGLGFTWAVNSGENRLTPWSNDPVCDTPGEALYLRDEHSGAFWSPTPAPAGRDAACLVRHGAGHTAWSRNSNGLEQTLRVFVPADDPVKIVTLKLVNRTDEPRRVTATYYVEWLLGALASTAKPHTACQYDATTRAILASNGWNAEFAGRIAFLTATLPPHSVTGSRRDFLGVEGSVADPAGLRQHDLGGRFAPDGDVCAAYQVYLDVGSGQSAEVTFVLGEGADRAETETLVAKWRDPAAAEPAFAGVKETWTRRLGAVQVKTPDPAFDLMINRWLLYQTTASRLMARAGYYQAGGAFGFRDQLQDVLALMFSEPVRARGQILRAAAHQFEEGDAQHWWHPPSGRGVRTHCSDDFIWLPFVAARYVEATGDASILDEEVAFLSAPPLSPKEHDRYALFASGERASLLEHCERALGRMMSVGHHGLPLIGTGDWNDGMDRIGDRGRGESVWLAWFQIATIRHFAPVLQSKGRDVGEFLAYAGSLEDAIARHAWDGEWYVRAFDDEGRPWGSRQNDECQIDAIAQTWAVIAGNPSDTRANIAMDSVRTRLVDRENRIIQLLDPPFHSTPRDPGYIKAYPAGIRENGGQYTHAATWVGHALARQGDGDGAWQIFDIINPVRRSATKADASHYAREPYVLAGDVYGPGPNRGLGGWSWYTGAAGWTWQLGVEAILGLRLEGGGLTIDPCLPRAWGRVEAVVSGPHGTIEVLLEDPHNLGHGKLKIIVDGKVRRTKRPIAFPGPGKTRKVLVTIGAGGGRS